MKYQSFTHETSTSATRSAWPPARGAVRCGVDSPARIMTIMALHDDLEMTSKAGHNGGSTCVPSL